MMCTIRLKTNSNNIRLDRLNVGDVDRGYVLLRLSSIPETKSEAIRFTKSRVQTSSIPDRQEKRLRRLQALLEGDKEDAAAAAVAGGYIVCSRFGFLVLKLNQ